MKLDIYNEELSPLESETFPDLSTLNFHLQTLARKHRISKGLMIVHDGEANNVRLSVADNEHSFFVD
jgi:hypothetical protein